MCLATVTRPDHVPVDGMPAGLVVMSPWVDVSDGRPSLPPQREGDAAEEGVNPATAAAGGDARGAERAPLVGTISSNTVEADSPRVTTRAAQQAEAAASLAARPSFGNNRPTVRDDTAQLYSYACGFASVLYLRSI